MVEVRDNSGNQEEEVILDQDRQWTGLLAQPQVLETDPCSVHLTLNQFNFADVSNVNTAGCGLINPNSSEEIIASSSPTSEVLLSLADVFTCFFNFKKEDAGLFLYKNMCCLCILLIRSPLISTFSFHCPKSNPSAFAEFSFSPMPLGIYSFLDEDPRSVLCIKF